MASLLKTEVTTLNNLDRIVNSMHPKNVLRRGYSITLLDGKAIRSKDQVRPGDIINTLLADGSFFSNVTFTSKTDENE